MEFIMFTIPYQRSSQLIQMLFCVLLLSLMSQIAIPLKPVPITLQSVAVMIIGLKFNRKVAVSSLCLYLLLGACRVPVFAGFSSGYQVLFCSPSCGYLIGFIPAVVVMSYVNKSFEYRWNILSCLSGTVTIFVCGVSWLSVGMGVWPAIRVGFLPFIIPGIVKVFLLTAILYYIDHGKKC
jgi:biotin transport system substrate-specific component